MKTDFIKTSVLLPGQITRELDRIATVTGIKRAALVRQAVEAFVGQDSSSLDLHRIATATAYCEVALDHIIGISAPEKRADLHNAVRARMDEFHVAR